MLKTLQGYECCYGRISKDKQSERARLMEKEIGEFLDVYCVSKNDKGLAALDYSAYGKRKFRKLNTGVIEEVINWCNYKNVKALHNKKVGGKYLKTIFFLEKNYKNALKLMNILWNPIYPIEHPIDEQIAIGLLLGYKHRNIIEFIERNYKIKMDKTKMVFVQIQETIDKMTVTLEELNEHSCIVLLDTIPNL
jgi:hypothetical protein